MSTSDPSHDPSVTFRYLGDQVGFETGGGFEPLKGEPALLLFMFFALSEPREVEGKSVHVLAVGPLMEELQKHTSREIIEQEVRDVINGGRATLKQKLKAPDGRSLVSERHAKIGTSIDETYLHVDPVRTSDVGRLRASVGGSELPPFELLTLCLRGKPLPLEVRGSTAVRSALKVVLAREQEQIRHEQERLFEGLVAHSDQRLRRQVDEQVRVVEGRLTDAREEAAAARSAQARAEDDAEALKQVAAQAESDARRAREHLDEVRTDAAAQETRLQKTLDEVAAVKRDARHDAERRDQAEQDLLEARRQVEAAKAERQVLEDAVGAADARVEEVDQARADAVQKAGQSERQAQAAEAHARRAASDAQIAREAVEQLKRATRHRTQRRKRLTVLSAALCAFAGLTGGGFVVGQQQRSNETRPVDGITMPTQQTPVQYDATTRERLTFASQLSSALGGTGRIAEQTEALGRGSAPAAADYALAAKIAAEARTVRGKLEKIQPPDEAEGMAKAIVAAVGGTVAAYDDLAVALRRRDARGRDRALRDARIARAALAKAYVDLAELNYVRRR